VEEAVGQGMPQRKVVRRIRDGDGEVIRHSLAARGKSDKLVRSVGKSGLELIQTMSILRAEYISLTGKARLALNMPDATLPFHSSLACCIAPSNRDSVASVGKYVTIAYKPMSVCNSG
jgi:hypothetical protein